MRSAFLFQVWSIPTSDFSIVVNVHQEKSWTKDSGTNIHTNYQRRTFVEKNWWKTGTPWTYMGIHKMCWVVSFQTTPSSLYLSMLVVFFQHSILHWETVHAEGSTVPTTASSTKSCSEKSGHWHSQLRQTYVDDITDPRVDFKGRNSCLRSGFMSHLIRLLFCSSSTSFLLYKLFIKL